MTRTPWTYALVGCLAALFGLEVATGTAGDKIALLRLGALPDNLPATGQYWRLLTYSLLHLNWPHLAANAALLWWAGRIVERRLGSAREMLVYTVSVLAAGLAIVVAHAGNPAPGGTVGASGGILGLLAAALVLVYRRDAAGFGQDTGVRVGVWASVAIAIGLSLLPGVSAAGHAAGFACGLALAPFLRVRPPPAQ